MRTVTYNPETHKLVPVEPTPEMRAAALSQFTLPRIWDAMLAAAPEAPEQADASGIEMFGMEVSVLHLGRLADELRGLLKRAISAMGALHDAASPNEDLSACIPYDAFHEFTDEHAALLHEWKYGAASPPVQPPPAKADHWQQYAKPGETAQQCIERHRAEQDALMTLLAQARSEPNAKSGGQEAVAFLVEGWHEGKLIAKTLEHTADEARGTAAVFAGHYPFIHTRPLYTAQQRREWVGLSEDEINHCIKFPRNLTKRDGTTSQRIARAVEEKLKERNNG